MSGPHSEEEEMMNMSPMVTLPNQERAKDYRQIVCTGYTTRQSTDKMFITFIHEELEMMQPVKTKLIMDFEVVFTVADARNFADSIYKNLEKMGLVAENGGK